MTYIHAVSSRCAKLFDRLALIHPYLADALVVAAIPALLLLSVTLCTTVISLPLALAFGWL